VGEEQGAQGLTLAAGVEMDPADQRLGVRLVPPASGPAPPARPLDPAAQLGQGGQRGVRLANPALPARPPDQSPDRQQGRRDQECQLPFS
jgi:hypothetical protein